MAELDDRAEATAFLRGGGATGALIAGYDWAATSLGPLDAWPQSLKTAAALVLRSPVAMVLRWGADGVMIYNDSYAEMAGEHHPRLLGAALRETAGDLAAFNDADMQAVLGGATRVLRDQARTIRQDGRVAQRWFDLDYSPVQGETGCVEGVLGVIVETTGRVLAERKAAREAERHRRMFEQAPGFIAILSGPDHVYEFCNETHRRLFGDREALGRSRDDVFADLPDHGFRDLLARVYATGERHLERAKPVAVRRVPGGPVEEAYIDFVVEPSTDDHGAVTGLFVEGFDVTEEVRAQAAAEKSERRLSAAVEIARLGAFEWDLETRHAAFDARAREIFGFDPDEPLTVDRVFVRIDPEDLPRIRAEAAADQAAGRTRYEREFRVHLPDGTVRDVVSMSDIVPGPDGQPRRTVGVFDDVTTRRRAEHRQRLLINELNHRVKNSLATVQSIAAQTLRSAPDLPNARDALEARLMALAAAHDLLTAESWNGARLSDVAASALAPFEATNRPQVHRSGPPVWLSAARALALSLALHELATNAAKYGALSVPEGRVTIRWSQTAAGDLTLCWTEDGGPPVAPPERSGFGARLLQRSLARELEGGVALDFAPEGVRCEIRFGVEPPPPAPEAARNVGAPATPC